jgi:excisionase family DNA binding protein
MALMAQHRTNQMQTPIRRAYSVPETTVILGICRDNVYRLIKQGRLPARKIGRRTVVLETDLQAFLEALPKLGAAS